MFMCVDSYSCKYTNRWVVMEGSSESGWRKSDSSRGFNPSALDRDARIVMSSGDTSHDSVRKGMERNVYNPISEGVGSEVGGEPAVQAVEFSDVSLRQWLDNPARSVDALECLHIFSQIVDIVQLAHSQGIVVQNVKPSCFIVSSSNRVSFIESASFSYSDSGSQEYGSKRPTATADFMGSSSSLGVVNARKLSSDTSCLQSCSGQAADERTIEDKKHSFSMKQILVMESNWYTSPEEASGTPTYASDIYQLGVLLFELFCTFGSMEDKSTTMANLRHRVLPPQLLLKWPKEASFCLWLLHPEPSSRPKLSELLQSDFLNKPRNDLGQHDAAMELREKIEEHELLLEFLLLLQRRKQDAADILNETISFVSSDIQEAAKLQKDFKIKGGACSESVKGLDSSASEMNVAEVDDSGISGSRKRNRQGIDFTKSDESDDHADESQKIESHSAYRGQILSKSSHLMKNFRKLESAYFLSRRRATRPTGWSLARHGQISSDGKGHKLSTERSSISNPSSKERYGEYRQSGWINTFLDGLCKYLSFSKLHVKADLKQVDLLSSSNLVCSLGFDRDGELFATAGVNKKIKVFEYNSLISEYQDIHYPVVEMASTSKLSSICWNDYIKSQIASSNFEGVVQVWDVSRSKAFMEMREHERRVWSIDFSTADPTVLASGSDDGSVKLWNINQGVSVGTIKTKANVCCVQFPPDSSHSLAFGSADHGIYYYDLRNSKMPLCTLVGHSKAVSYVKFIDSTTLVSASTDNTLKLWDLSMCTSRVVDCPLQSFTGHLNVKNFVGLSVSEGYIATGSETNEVFIYYKAFPMPVLSFKFNSKNPVCGDETAQFVSSVCWRNQSTSLIAANSMGHIKLLEMV